MVIYIWTKSGADWFIFVDVKSVNKEMWTDNGQIDEKRMGDGQTLKDSEWSQ